MSVPARILVVDDYPPSRYAFRRILATGGYAVLESGDAVGARAVADEGVDLVIADVNLPGTTGIDLCRELRAAHANLPVILISASYRSGEYEEAWRSAGAAHFLEQPIDADRLLAVVREVLA